MSTLVSGKIPVGAIGGQFPQRSTTHQPARQKPTARDILYEAELYRGIQGSCRYCSLNDTF